MADTVGSHVSRVDDALYEVSYQAALTRTLGLWLMISIAVLVAPIFWGAFGLFVLAGILVLYVAIPVRVVVYRRRLVQLPADHQETCKARAALNQALLLWLLSPLMWIFVGVVFGLIAERGLH